MQIAELVQYKLKSGVDREEFKKFHTAFNNKTICACKGILSFSQFSHEDYFSDLMIWTDKASLEAAQKTLETMSVVVEGFENKTIFDYMDFDTIKVTQMNVEKVECLE